MSENDTLGRNQRRAIPAILASRTIQEAAEKIGLSERTVRRYLADPTFRAALGQAENQAIHEAARRLIQGGADALDVLETLMKSAESESVQRLAASDWLNNVLRWAELVTVAARVSELEGQVYGDKES